MKKILLGVALATIATVPLWAATNTTVNQRQPLGQSLASQQKDQRMDTGRLSGPLTNNTVGAGLQFKGLFLSAPVPVAVPVVAPTARERQEGLLRDKQEKVKKVTAGAQ